VAYHVNAIPVKDNENKHTRNAYVSAYVFSCALSLSPKIFLNSGILVPCGYGGGQISCHKFSDMTAPQGTCLLRAYLGMPQLFLPLLNR
jgi:hypothetical protein